MQHRVFQALTSSSPFEHRISIMSNQIRLHNSAALGDPAPYVYSHAATVPSGCEYVHLAGHVGADGSGKIEPDFTTQLRKTFANIRTCLSEVGGSLRSIVSMTLYVVDYDADSMPVFKLLRDELTGEDGLWPPPTALVPVPALALPELKVEIQCTAAIQRHPTQGLQNSTAQDRNIRQVDVVVVGAGLSGLQAATDVQHAGLSCVVMEAMDRVGGKTLSTTVEHTPGKLDLGAAWINDKTHSKMYALFRKFELEPIVQKMGGDEVFRMGNAERSFRTTYPGLPAVDPKQQQKFEQIAKDMDIDSATIDLHDSTANDHLEDISVQSYLERKGATGFSLEFWRAWIHDLTGCDPEDIGLVYWLDYVKSNGGMDHLLSDGPDGAQYMTNRRGKYHSA